MKRNSTDRDRNREKTLVRVFAGVIWNQPWSFLNGDVILALTKTKRAEL
jgi:hypothetical protein